MELLDFQDTIREVKEMEEVFREMNIGSIYTATDFIKIGMTATSVI